MNAAKNKQPVQLEIGETAAVTEKQPSAVQLEIAGIVDKYATSVANVQKGTVGEIGKLTRAMAFAGALAVTPSAGMAGSPYEPLAANEGGVTLVLKEEPSQNADIKTIMERYKQGEYFEKIASMPVGQRQKLMEYYKKGKEAGVKDRLLATGLGSLVSGYSDIEAVKVFVSEYQKTGKMGKYLPLPYLSFTNAAEKFPEAQTMFANELETTKKMEAQIKSIIELSSADADKRSADADKRSADMQKRIDFLNGILKGIK
ncbi:MAG: hypothetical protein QMC36_06300 [Patescibacteria group bacterium]